MQNATTPKALNKKLKVRLSFSENISTLKWSCHSRAKILVQLTTQMKLRCKDRCRHIIEIDIHIGCTDCQFINILHNRRISNPYLTFTGLVEELVSIVHRQQSLLNEICVPYSNIAILNQTNAFFFSLDQLFPKMK